jgi:hypothetical protein
MALLAVVAGELRAAPVVSSVRVGWQGRSKLGYWRRVAATISGIESTADARFMVHSFDADGSPTSVTKKVRLVAGESTTVAAYVKTGRRESAINVTLVDSATEKTLIQRTLAASDFPPAMEIDAQLIITVGPPVGVDGAAALLDRAARSKLQIVAYDDFSALPTEAIGYDGVDCVIVSTGAAGVATAEHARQIAALVEWVRLGGRTLLSVGSRADETLALGSPLAPLAPGSFAAVESLRPTSALQRFVEQTGESESSLLPRNHRADDNQQPITLNVARLDKIDGRIDLQFAETPLVVRRPVGFGESTFVAFDLESTELARWSEKPKLLFRLLDWKATRSDENQSTATTWHGGESRDLAEQLDATLDRFDGVTAIPFWVVAAAAVVFLAIIGPLDYFLLVRRFRRPAWTWATFPLCVLIAVGGMAAVERWSTGSVVRASAIELIDVDFSAPGDGRPLVRGTSLLRLYSPDARAFDLEFQPSKSFPMGDGARVRFSWSASPGEGLGGLHSAVRSGTATQTLASVEGEAAITDVPLRAATSRGLVARWHGEVELSNETELTLGPLGRRPYGAVVNPLDEAVDDAVLLFGSLAFRLGRIEPHEAVLIDDHVAASDPRELLSNAATSDDWQRLDERAIARRIGFYELAGGPEFASGKSDYLTALDMSRLVELSRAVLVGVIDGGSTIVDNAEGRPIGASEGRRAIVVRIVYRVDRGTDGANRDEAATGESVP